MAISVSGIKLKLFLNGGLAAFGLYFCMYAFRKPFTVATFEGMEFAGIDYKIILVLAQVIGYMLSKFIGIRLVSSLRSNQRATYLTLMILGAELSLILFGVLPGSYNFIFLFFNGLSLGMIWGIVFSYLEGRRMTEILGIVLCSSFIVSSGAVKSVGLLVINELGFSQFWMPAVTGAFFLIPFFICLWLLERLPPPNVKDQLARKKRNPMSSKDRRNVILNFFFPLLILIIFYTALTALRDFRDNFSRELWDSIGFKDNAGIFTISEIPIAIAVLIMLGLFGLIKNNYKAFMGFHFVLLFCSFLIGMATVLFQNEVISPILWMILVGFGLYACYVPFNSIFFDRMIATYQIEGNAGFLIYLADSFGYLGSIGVLLYKNFGGSNMSWLNFFVKTTYIVAVMGVVISVSSLFYFRRKFKKEKMEMEYNLYLVK